jgi:hypothetical protein
MKFTISLSRQEDCARLSRQEDIPVSGMYQASSQSGHLVSSRCYTNSEYRKELPYSSETLQEERADISDLVSKSRRIKWE